MNTIEFAYQPFATAASASRVSYSWLWIALIAFGLIFILIAANRANNADAPSHDSDSRMV